MRWIWLGRLIFLAFMSWAAVAVIVAAAILVIRLA